MEPDEIEVLQETIAAESTDKIDPLEDDAIYAMSEGAGWKIMVKKANRTIAQLLEPVDASDLTSDTNLELIGANSLANAKAIKVLRSFINQAESVRKARRMSIPKPEEPKQEA